MRPRHLPAQQAANDEYRVQLEAMRQYARQLCEQSRLERDYSDALLTESRLLRALLQESRSEARSSSTAARADRPTPMSVADAKPVHSP